LQIVRLCTLGLANPCSPRNKTENIAQLTSARPMMRGPALVGTECQLISD
jgi:hypothetical protein